MAKKGKKIEDESKKVVANCDQSKMAEIIKPLPIKDFNIESLIRTVRGQRVMFDSDLAML
ncbi:ORF6N domain-containing protein [Prevotella sp. E15-22]|uniref:ORF6N domain-containing protein n=1 Tax=Prevotella sp. E15-22 TaxID=2937774 RepID=UPI00204FB7EE|nr:ORF6N domain-containing protein [Prevotella sp. E15-22]UPS43462.1 ORF6N domain-containing protein [Prevotella sp. E15-22]